MAEALAGLSRASRSLTGGAQLDPILAEVVAAAAVGAGADLAAIWLPGPGGSLAARAVWAPSGALAAEVESLRALSLEEAAQLARAHVDGDASGLTIPLEVNGAQGSLELVRRGEAVRA